MRILKLFPFILLGFLFWNIARDWQAVVSYWSDFLIIPFLISFFFLLVDYPEAAFGWHVLLRKMNINLKVRETMRIWIISTTARYLPGSIWQYVGRLEMARSIGIPRGKTAVSLLLETFLALMAGIFVAILALPFIPVAELGTRLWIFFLLVPLVFLHPSVANKIIGIIARVSKKEVRSLDIKFGTRDTISVFPLYVVNFFINGLALYFLVMALMPGVEVGQLFAFTGFYALAWVLGFIALFAPAGIGVTEVSLSYFLSFSMPLGLASTIALSYRFFLTIAELIIFALFWRIKR